jgi:hypothetical protein
VPFFFFSLFSYENVARDVGCGPFGDYSLVAVMDPNLVALADAVARRLDAGADPVSAAEDALADAPLERLASLAVRVEDGGIVLRRDGFTLRTDDNATDTTVHSHDRVSAFRIVRGDHAHALCTFTPARGEGTPVVLGALRTEAFELLRAGDVRTLRSPRDRHALAALARDACSLHVVFEALPGERSYVHLGPEVACDARLAPQTERDAVLEAACAAMGAESVLRDAMAHERWRENVLAWRDDLDADAREHRDLLTLLSLDLPSPMLAEALRARFGRAPADVIAQHVRELARTRDDGAVELLDLEIPPDLAPDLTAVLTRARVPTDARWRALEASIFRPLIL